MMKKFAIGILLLISALCGAALFGCDSAPEILNAPQNLRLENNVLYWDEVEHASGYAIYFDETEQEIDENRFDFSYLERYDEPFEVEVLAIGDSTGYLDSDWVKYSCVLKDYTYGLSYTLTDDGTGYIASKTSTSENEKPLTGSDSDYYIYIPDEYNGLPVKEVGELYCSTKKQTALIVHMPASIEKISHGAFAGFKQLTKIEIPEKVTSIERGTFMGCTSLVQITLPEGLISIEEYAFRDCSMLSKINLPEKLATIGERAFSGCRSLTQLNFPQNLVSIGDNAFEGCKSLRAVRFSSPAEIQGWAFYNCTALTDVDFFQGVSVFGCAFYNCTALKAIDCAPCSRIGAAAFEHCSGLTEIQFPKDATVYHPYAFTETGWYKNQPDGYVIVNGDTLFRFKGDVPNGGVIDEFPSQIKQIAASAFATSSLSDGSNLTWIEIPDDVRLCGDSIFFNCQSLKHVKLPRGMTEIYKNTFNTCLALESIEIPEGVTKIDWFAFTGCSLLKSIKFPSTLTEIDSAAFIRCDSLTKLYLPAGVTTLSPYTFNDVNYEEIILPVSLNTLLAKRFTDETIIYYRGTEEQWNEYFAEVDYKGTRYYYSETPPDDNGNYWHFAPDGVTPVIWKNE